MLLSFSCCLSAVPKLPLNPAPIPIDTPVTPESAMFVVAINLSTGDSITGSAIKVENYRGMTLVLTAGHVCYPETEDPFGINLQQWQMAAFDFDGIISDVKILAVDTTQDVCVFAILGESKYLTPVANNLPKVGERVFLLANPLGVYEPEHALVFEGFYGGENGHQATYTIPVAPGASGGGIMNSKNEIIGIVSMATTSFETLTFAVTLKDIQALLDVSKRVPGRVTIIK